MRSSWRQSSSAHVASPRATTDTHAARVLRWAYPYLGLANLWCGWFGGLDAVGLLAHAVTLATLATKRNAPANLAQGALVLLALSLHFHLRLPSAYRLSVSLNPLPRPQVALHARHVSGPEHQWSCSSAHGFEQAAHHP